METIVEHYEFTIVCVGYREVTFMTDLNLCSVTFVSNEYKCDQIAHGHYRSRKKILLIRTQLESLCCLIQVKGNDSKLCISCRHKCWTVYTLSMIFWKCTSTVQLWTSLCWSELWISTESFLDRIFWALYPNTKSIESITLDFPLPLGPMMQEKRWGQGEKKKTIKKTRIADELEYTY